MASLRDAGKSSRVLSRAEAYGVVVGVCMVSAIHQTWSGIQKDPCVEQLPTLSPFVPTAKVDPQDFTY